MSDTPDAIDRERLRQQALLQALWQRLPASELTPWLQAGARHGIERGLATYRANAAASAERALAARFPTVLALLGDEAFGALARQCWREHPPERGDLDEAGGAFPDLLDREGADSPWPYLGDVARLDAAVADAERAADQPAEPESLALLAQDDPSQMVPRWAPGLVLVPSPHPIVALYRAHHAADEAERDACRAAARDALQQQSGETALVWRRAWKAQVLCVDAREAAWTEALLAGRSLGDALSQAGDGFEFEAWLIAALQRGQLLGVRRL
jgi:hypothetical protein